MYLEDQVPLKVHQILIYTFQDNMNRQLNCMISRSGDSAGTLAEELVLHGFIHTADSSLIQVTSRGGGYLVTIHDTTIGHKVSILFDTNHKLSLKRHYYK